MEKPLMNLRPQSEFEKLVWERAANKNLCEALKEAKYELGVMQSEMAELVAKHEAEIKKLKAEMQKTQVGQLVIANSNKKQLIADLEEKLRELKQKYNLLEAELIRVKNPELFKKEN